MTSWFALRVFTNHLKLIGPLDFDGMKDQLRTGRISFSDFVYQPQDKRKWVRAFEVADLLCALPQAPADEEFHQFESQIKKVASLPVDRSLTERLQRDFKDDWYLQFQGDELGPFSFIEMEKIFNSGRLNGEILAWQKKLTNWIKVSSFQNLMESLPHAVAHADQFVVERNSEKRAYRRHSLIASVSLRTAAKLTTGICADVSEGGIQALQLDADVKVGDVFTLLVHPISISGVPLFEAQAKLVWADKISNRMGFKFINEIESRTISLYLSKTIQIKNSD